MEFVNYSVLPDFIKIEIFNLWNNEYPLKLGHESIEEFDVYLEKLSEKSCIILIDQNNKIRGWYFDFYRENEKWFVIILDSKIHGKGYGTKLLNLAKQKENESNGWVIDHNKDQKRNGEFYNSPLDFYLKNGFEKISKDRLESDKISAVKIRWRR